MYYIDNLLISFKSFDERVAHLDTIFGRLEKHNFTLRRSKSQFCKDVMPFIGFIVLQEGCIPDPEKIENILNF